MNKVYECRKCGSKNLEVCSKKNKDLVINRIKKCKNCGQSLYSVEITLDRYATLTEREEQLKSFSKLLKSMSDYAEEIIESEQEE